VAETMARFALETPIQRSVFGFTLAFAILPTFFVLLRIFAHRLARRKLDASDYCIIAACVSLSQSHRDLAQYLCVDRSSLSAWKHVASQVRYRRYRDFQDA